MKIIVPAVLQVLFTFEMFREEVTGKCIIFSQTVTCAIPYIVNRAPIKSYGQFITLKMKFVPY